MILDINESMFNSIKISLLTDKDELNFAFKKNLKTDEILAQVDEIKWKDKFHIRFSEKVVDHWIKNNEFYWSIKIPVSKIEWIKVGSVIKTDCQMQHCENVPDIILDEIKKSPITTDVMSLKDIECSINDYKFAPKYHNPLRWLEIEVNNSDGSKPIIDLSEYDTTNVDVIAIFGMFEFEVINIPLDFEESYKIDDGIAIKITPEFGSELQNIVKLDDFIPINRNNMKFVRKGL